MLIKLGNKKQLTGSTVANALERDYRNAGGGEVKYKGYSYSLIEFRLR